MADAVAYTAAVDAQMSAARGHRAVLLADLSDAEERAAAAEGARQTAEDRIAAADEARMAAEDRVAAADGARKAAEDRAAVAEAERPDAAAAEAERSNTAAAFCAHAAALRANAAALGAAIYAGRAEALAESARGETMRETLAAELETALNDADAARDALRRRAPPPPAADRRSVSAPVEPAVASLEADLDTLRRDVASLRPRQASYHNGVWVLAAASLVLTAWILTPEDPYAAALAS